MENEYTPDEFKSIRNMVDKVIDATAKKKRKIKMSENENKEPSNKCVEKQVRFSVKPKRLKKLPLKSSQSINEQEAIEMGFKCYDQSKTCINIR